MCRPRLFAPNRLWILALLAALPFAAPAREARASGCHVEDRPRFGVSGLDARARWTVLGSSVEASRSSWSPKPCAGGEDAASGSPAGLIAAAIAAEAVEGPAPRCPGKGVHPIDQAESSRSSWADLARPPR